MEEPSIAWWLIDDRHPQVVIDVEYSVPVGSGGEAPAEPKAQPMPSQLPYHYLKVIGLAGM